jgi:hypothetical protein
MCVCTYVQDLQHKVSYSLRRHLWSKTLSQHKLDELSVCDARRDVFEQSKVFRTWIEKRATTPKGGLF